MFPLVFLKDFITFYICPITLLVCTLINCRTRTKFDSDARAHLVTQNSQVYPSPRKSISPTVQNPPANTPVARIGSVEEDTLANLKSLPAEKSDVPEDQKMKNS